MMLKEDIFEGPIQISRRFSCLLDCLKLTGAGPDPLPQELLDSSPTPLTAPVALP